MEKFNFQQSHILATHLRLIFSRKSYCVLLELFVGNTIKNWNKVFSKKKCHWNIKNNWRKSSTKSTDLLMLDTKHAVMTTNGVVSATPKVWMPSLGKILKQLANVSTLFNNTNQPISICFSLWRKVYQVIQNTSNP